MAGEAFEHHKLHERDKGMDGQTTLVAAILFNVYGPNVKMDYFIVSQIYEYIVSIVLNLNQSILHVIMCTYVVFS